MGKTKLQQVWGWGVWGYFLWTQLCSRTDAIFWAMRPHISSVWIHIGWAEVRTSAPGAEVDEPTVGFNIRFRNQILTSAAERSWLPSTVARCSGFCYCIDCIGSQSNQQNKLTKDVFLGKTLTAICVADGSTKLWYFQTTLRSMFQWQLISIETLWMIDLSRGGLTQEDSRCFLFVLSLPIPKSPSQGCHGYRVTATLAQLRGRSTTAWSVTWSTAWRGWSRRCSSQRSTSAPQLPWSSYEVRSLAVGEVG